jgi:hypothetical protein
LRISARREFFRTRGSDAERVYVNPVAAKWVLANLNGLVA